MLKKISFLIFGIVFFLYNVFIFIVYDQPINEWFLICLILSCSFIFLAIFDIYKKKFKFTINQKIIHIFKMSILFVGGIFLIIASLIIFWSNENSLQKTDYLIVLGSSLKNGNITPKLKSRLDKAIDAYKKNSSAIIIVSGGIDFSETKSEAEVMKMYLIKKGVSETSILKEENSTSTMENIVYSKKIMDSHSMKKYNVAIVTSDFHVFRTNMLAKRNNIKCYFISSQSETLLFPMIF